MRIGNRWPRKGRIAGSALMIVLMLCGSAMAQNYDPFGPLDSPGDVLAPPTPQPSWRWGQTPQGEVPPLPSAPFDNMEAASRKIMLSIAVIATKLDDKGTFEIGTGFCVYSTSSASYFLTNHHVVAAAGWAGDQKQVYVKPNTSTTNNKVFVGHVKAIRPPAFDFEKVPDHDLAVVRIDVGNIPPLVIATGELPIGHEIGITGYPWFKIDNSSSIEDMQPSAHFGHINGSASYKGGYELVEFDAVADHGNSGGPMFDITGRVYGVVTLGIVSEKSTAVQNNLAIKGSQLHDFFVFDARIPYHYYHDYLNGQTGEGVQYPLSP